MAAAAENLSRGALSMILNDGVTSDELKPILQVTAVRTINQGSVTAERFRIMVFDGILSQQAMLSTQMNGIVKSGKLQKGSVVKFTEYVCNTILDRKIIIVIGLDVLPGEIDAVQAEMSHESDNFLNRAAVPPQFGGGDRPSPAAASIPSYGSSYVSGPVAGQGLKREPALNPCGDPYGKNSSNMDSVSSGYGQGNGTADSALCRKCGNLR